MDIDHIQRRRWWYGASGIRLFDIWSFQALRYLHAYTAENLAGSPIRFAFFIITDGYTAHALFERPKTNNGGKNNLLKQLMLQQLILIVAEEYPATRNELQKLPRDMDVGAWQSGIYHLSKRPQGLDAIRLQNSRIVGIDPGKLRYRISREAYFTICRG